MFDKFLCKHIDERPITIGDFIVWSTKYVLHGLVIIWALDIAVWGFGIKTTALVTGGMIFALLISPIEIAHCQNEEDGE